MVDHTVQSLLAEIDRLRRLDRGVGDDRVHATIEKMVEELERRLSELEAASPNCKAGRTAMVIVIWSGECAAALSRNHAP